MRPLLLRPPFLDSGAIRVFSGSSLVMSLKSDTDMNRRPADVGLYRLTATGLHPRSECFDGLARRHGDDGLLPAAARPGGHAAALRLRGHLADVDVEHRDVEDLLDGLADLGLVCLWVHAERVLAALGD